MNGRLAGHHTVTEKQSLGLRYDQGTRLPPTMGSRTAVIQHDFEAVAVKRDV
jgi:hypothetical protein